MNKMKAGKFFLPGENTRMVFVASLIGVIAGLANICFRTVLEFVHQMIFVPNYPDQRYGSVGPVGDHLPE